MIRYCQRPDTTVKKNGYIFRGSNLAIFIASLVNWGQHLKERIHSCRSKFFTIKVGFILEGLCFAKTHRGCYESCSPFVKIAKNIHVYLCISLTVFLQELRQFNTTTICRTLQPLHAISRRPGQHKKHRLPRE